MSTRRQPPKGAIATKEERLYRALMRVLKEEVDVSIRYDELDGNICIEIRDTRMGIFAESSFPDSSIDDIPNIMNQLCQMVLRKRSTLNGSAGTEDFSL